MGQQPRVGGAPRQRHLAPVRIDDVAVLVVGQEQAADIADVVGQAGDDDVGIVLGRHVAVQRAAAQDFVTGQGHQHGVLDIVIERVAIADAFERDAGDRWHRLDQIGLR